MFRFHTLAVLLFTSDISAQVFHDVQVPCCQFRDMVTNTSTTNITAGTTVRWTLQGNTPHTITSGMSPSASGAGAMFDMPINSQNPVRTFTFNTPGTYPYFCQPHFGNGMTGVVTVTVPASVSTVGSGCVGSGGGVLTLGAVGLPAIGSATFALTVTGGVPQGSGFLYGALGAAGPGIPVTSICNLYLDLTTFFFFLQSGVSPVGPIPLNASGAATIPFPVPNLQSWAGGRLDLQFGAVDLGAPGGFTVSNALTLNFGN